MTTTAKADREVAKVQLTQAGEEALKDNVVSGEVVESDGKTYDYIELKDEKFRVRESVGAMAMLKWSAAAELSSDDPKALSAIYSMIKSVILLEDWPKFESHALDSDADAEELLDVVAKSLEIVSGRPTKQS